MKLIFSVSFIFINLHDIYQAHLETQQVYDPCSSWGVSRVMDSHIQMAFLSFLSFTRSHLEKKANILTSL